MYGSVLVYASYISFCFTSLFSILVVFSFADVPTSINIEELFRNASEKKAESRAAAVSSSSPSLGHAFKV